MLEMGFAGYLAKPIQKATLFQELSRFVGHVPKETPDQGPSDDEMAPVDAYLLPRVIGLLEDKYMQMWEKVRQDLFFDKIGEFGRQLSELGNTYAVAVLKNYGEELSAHAESFDVEKMNTTLNAFPEVVAGLKSQSVQE